MAITITGGITILGGFTVAQPGPIGYALWMWGVNSEGTLGQGNTINKSSPIQLGSLTTWANAVGIQYNAIAFKP